MRDLVEPTGRCFLFCKADKRIQAEAIYAQIDFGDGLVCFPIPLCGASSPSDSPATHYGANTVIDSILDSEIKGSSPTLTRYFSEDGWTWETALKDMWLQTIESEV